MALTRTIKGSALVGIIESTNPLLINRLRDFDFAPFLLHPSNLRLPLFEASPYPHPLKLINQSVCAYIVKPKNIAFYLEDTPVALIYVKLPKVRSLKFMNL